MHTALAVLPPKVRAALILRDIEREPVGAIAEMLGVTVGSASVALHRARGRARRAYEGARGLLAPSGLFDTVRRWVARTAQHGMPLTDSAGAVCASVCAAALVFAISVSMGEPEPAPRTIATQGRSRPVAVIHAAGRGETARQATPVGATAAALRSTRVPGPSADAPRATTSTEPEVAVPGTPVWASTKPPKAKKSVSIAVEREVAGQRVSAGADYYDDTGLVELVEDEPRALRP